MKLPPNTFDRALDRVAMAALQNKRALEMNKTQRIEAIQHSFESFSNHLSGLVGPCREQSLMITKLQEGSFWAMAGVQVGPEPSELELPPEKKIVVPA